MLTLLLNLKVAAITYIFSPSSKCQCVGLFGSCPSCVYVILCGICVQKPLMLLLFLTYKYLTFGYCFCSIEEGDHLFSCFYST